MRIAILADIHANAGALEATLAEARKHGAERLILLGDYVGYHFDAARCLDLLFAWPFDAIRGNHDRALLDGLDRPETLDAYRHKYGPGVDVALQELSPEGLAWLAGLPDSQTLRLGRHELLLCHGAPFDPDQYIYWNSPPELIERCASVEADAVLMGHTHHPFLHPGAPWLLNPGSVGQARDIGGMASWCLFDADLGTISFRRTAYDPTPVIARLRAEWPGSARQQETLVRRNPAAAAGAHLS